MTLDFVVRGAKVFDAFSGRFRSQDIAISEGCFVGPATSAMIAKRVLDASDHWLVPGLIDTHVHMESSHLSPAQFARAVLPHGTTTVIADPHEVANVFGMEGVRFMLRATKQLALRCFFMAPSCVPSSPFETTGGILAADQVREILTWDRVLGLGEVMNYPGVLDGDLEILEKIAASRGRPIDGHAPGLTGARLASYVAAGPRSDHESTTQTEAEEKLSTGMHVLIREGSAARNLDALLPILNERTAPFVHFCSDDRNAEALFRRGHIDEMVRRAIAFGVPAEAVLTAATIHAARAYGLEGLGAIAPGYRADFLLLSDLSSFTIRDVYVGGTLAAERGACVARTFEAADPDLRRTVHVSADVSFRLFAGANAGRARVIGVLPDQVLTEEIRARPRISNGEVVADVDRDLLKAAVVERHTGSGRVGLALVRGFGLRSGAIASTVAHDAHNLVVVGASDEEMAFAVQALIEIGGGQVAVRGDSVLEILPLPIAGLMSDRPLAEVALSEAALRSAAQGLGCTLPEPFMTLSFLALPVIPHLKLTDRGLVDVDAFEFASLYVD